MGAPEQPEWPLKSIWKDPPASEWEKMAKRWHDWSEHLENVVYYQEWSIDEFRDEVEHLEAESSARMDCIRDLREQRAELGIKIMDLEAEYGGLLKDAHLHEAKVVKILQAKMRYLEAEKERLARVAEDYIASLDRCTERALHLERKLDTLTANPSTETPSPPRRKGECDTCDYDPCGYAQGYDCPGYRPKPTEESQIITEADAAAGLKKMFEESEKCGAMGCWGHPCGLEKDHDGQHCHGNVGSTVTWWTDEDAKRWCPKCGLPLSRPPHQSNAICTCTPPEEPRGGEQIDDEFSTLSDYMSPLEEPREGE